MVNTDVVVIGAGPAGLIAAREAAKRGANVTVLEEHKEIGVPCHCAGLLSVKGLLDIGVPLSADFVQNKIKGACFHSPSGLSFTVERKEAVACVVDRSKFDKFLAQQAAHTGAEIRLKSKAQQVSRHNQGIVVEGLWGSIDASVVIDAEGLGSRFVRAMGLTPLKSECLLPALQFDLVNISIDPKYAEIHVGTKIAPGFFAWVIPLNENSARVGLACKGANTHKRLESFVKSRFSKFDRVSVRPGFIVTCGPILKTFDDNFLVVGDAAGHVKPTTGGGIILGGICASIAGEVTAKAAKKGSFTSPFLGEYERVWKKRLEREFKVARLAREVMNRLSDKTVDKIFRIVVEKNLQAEFSMKGDMDFQAGLLSALGKKRDILRVLLIAAPDLISLRMKQPAFNE